MSMFEQAGDGITRKAQDGDEDEAREKAVSVAAHTRKPKRTLEELVANLPEEQVIQAGANASVIIFSLLETAKANGLNPEAYLSHLLTVLPERFAADPKASVDDLLPWTQEMCLAFKTEISDAER